jgi:N-acetylglutamate synthase-like GNAT family acetyltransferase
VNVREATSADRAAVDAFLEARSALLVARLGELVDARLHPALIAERDGRLAGVATYVLDDDRCELLTLHAEDRGTGVGTALIEAVEEVARRAGCRSLGVITTNDNVDALRFYQRRGFSLTALHRGAVDESRRTLKPEIPAIGEHGIPIRDELELQKDLVRD